MSHPFLQKFPIEPSFPTLIDNTQVNNFRSCRRKFLYYSILKRTPTGTNPHLNAGSAYAKGLEVFRHSYYGDGKDKQDSLQAGVLAAIKSYGSHEPGENAKPSEAAKTWDRVAASVISYTQMWPPETDHIRPAIFDGKASAEFSFGIPLPIPHPDTGEPILYGGVFDAMVRFGDSGFTFGHTYDDLPLYGLDDKTTYQMGASWAEDWSLRGQFLGYYWAARKLGFPLRGFVVRGTAIQKTQIKHMECILLPGEWKIEEWYSDLLQTVNEMVSCYEHALYGKNWGDSCVAYGGCPYNRLCDSPSPEKWIQTHYEERTWSPIDLEKL